MKTFFLTGLLLLTSGFTSAVWAVKAYPYPIEVQQPNGDTIFIRLHGDEYFHYTTAGNGAVIMKDSEGYFCYAGISGDSILIPGDMPVSNASLRSDMPGLITPSSLEFKEKIQQPAMNRMVKEKWKQAVDNKPLSTPSLRSSNKKQEDEPYRMKALVILADFQDVKFTTTNAMSAFDRLLNQSGYNVNGATGSVRDYFFDNSDGAFEPDFEVFGPITLPKEMSYYGANKSNGYDQNVRQMIIDACKETHKAYKSIGFNMNDYAVEYEGYGAVLQNVFVVYAGYNEAEGGGDNTVWPQKSTMFDSYNQERIDNVLLADFACTSELQGNVSRPGGIAAIGTFCHEFGHVIGLPDLYDANYETDGFNGGVGFWSIMDTGNYTNNSRTPPCYSATERYFLTLRWDYEINWMRDLYILPVNTHFAAPRFVDIEPISSDYNPDGRKVRGYMMETQHQMDGFTYEFFMLENRKKTGWDYYLRGEGMLVFHVDWDPVIPYTIHYSGEEYSLTAFELWDMGLPNLMGDHLCYDLLKANNDPCVIVGNSASYQHYDGHPFPGSSNNTSLTDNTTPNLLSWAGNSSGTGLANIKRSTDGII